MGATKEKIKRIYETLPQLNCGLCGFEGCGQFAMAVAEGRASPFGCRQNPWIGYEVSDIIGLRTPFSGYPNRFYQPSLMSGPGLSPSLESLGKEVRGLLSRMESILDRIDTLDKRGEEFSTPIDMRRKIFRTYSKIQHYLQTKTMRKGGD